jgi:enoyl-CoA hydratase
METVLELTTLRMTLDEGLAHVELIRPELLNRIDEDTHAQFIEMMDVVEANTDIRAVLLSSTGKAFSAGGDANWMREVNGDRARAKFLVEQGYRLMYGLLGIRVPIVCAVQGAAMGIGANIAFACDAVVALPSARFADSHVRMGLVAGDGGVVVWPQSGGMIRAKRHLLTGDPITAEQAFAAGMVTDLVDDPEELVPTAKALARRMADLPPLAVQLTKRTLNRILQQRAAEAFELSLAYELHTMGSEDLMEATAAFLEKRPGKYQGR